MAGAWLGRLWSRTSETNASMLAAAVAFYMMLSLFPALATLISAYGLIADPATIARQLDLARDVLPPEVLSLVAQEITSLLSAQNQTLGIGVIAGALVTIWSARSGATALMAALNAVYRVPEQRGLLWQQGVALLLTLGGIAIMILAFIAMAVVPAMLALLPFALFTEALLSALRWPISATAVLIGFVLTYRFAPCRAAPGRWHILTGAAAAAILWIGGSVGFSLYVAHLGSYDRVYGSVGAVVVLLLWFYVSAFAILIGAAVDAEMGAPQPGAAANAQEPA